MSGYRCQAPCCCADASQRSSNYLTATAWKEHSVRGVMSGASQKWFGLVIVSEKVEGRGRNGLTQIAPWRLLNTAISSSFGSGLPLTDRPAASPNSDQKSKLSMLSALKTVRSGKRMMPLLSAS
ncbi:DUF3489 domain-containing protein [Mesorhizobium quangtriensis]|uniref:DUF3489 domain-containing protein n=1 Tax=Mesorhizobium quangtriensis TaxID=3157709 RepID=UPI003CCDC67C